MYKFDRSLFELL